MLLRICVVTPLLLCVFAGAGAMDTSPYVVGQVLTVEQSYDVAGYIESLPRPERTGREHDFPNPEFRPN